MKVSTNGVSSKKPELDKDQAGPRYISKSTLYGRYGLVSPRTNISKLLGKVVQ